MSIHRFTCNRSLLFLLSTTLLLLSACHQEKEIYPQAQVMRYDKALMEIDTANIRTELYRLAQQYPLFLEGADLDDTINLIRIRNFICDPLSQLAYEKAKEVYENPEHPERSLEHRLGVIFGRTGKIFPNFKSPTVYTYNSYFDFANRIIYMDSILSIAIDLYTFDNEKYMTEMGVPRYISRRMNQEHLDADVAKVVLAHEIGERNGTRLLDYIVHDGKILYLMKKILPETPENILLGYSLEELEWCNEHEKEVWNFIVQRNLLFESNPSQFRHFVNEGPFNSQIQGAPARINQYIGIKMIEKYMKKSGSDINGLLKANADNILRTSQYKP